MLTILNSSCALGAGQRRACEPQPLPTRPPKNLCISNGDGTCQLYNSTTQKEERISDTNFVCKNISDYNREQEYIDDLVRIIQQ